MINKIDNISKLFDFANSTVYKWKKENRPIVNLIEKYFDDEDIEEFLGTGEIKKFDRIIQTIDNYMTKNKLFYITTFTESQSLLHEPSMYDEFRDFYFNFLANFGKIDFPFNINILGIQSLLSHYLFQYQTQKIKENLYQNKNFQKENLKNGIIEDIFSNNERYFEGIMLHFFTFNNWNNDMYYFLELVKKDEFDYFINSKNDELLYQAIGYLVYSYYQNLNMRDKLALIHSTYHYFIANKNLISKENIKKHILDRVNNPKVFKEIDEKLFSDYINSPFPENLTNNFDIDFENEEIETVTFEDLIKNDRERKLKN